MTDPIDCALRVRRILNANLFAVAEQSAPQQVSASAIKKTGDRISRSIGQNKRLKERRRISDGIRLLRVARAGGKAIERIIIALRSITIQV